MASISDKHIKVWNFISGDCLKTIAVKPSLITLNCKMEYNINNIMKLNEHTVEFANENNAVKIISLI